MKYVKYIIGVSIILIIIFSTVQYSADLREELHNYKEKLDKEQTDNRLLASDYYEMEDHYEILLENEISLNNVMMNQAQVIKELRSEIDELNDALQVLQENETIFDFRGFTHIGTFENGDQVFIEHYVYNTQDAAWRMVILGQEEIVSVMDSFPSKPKFKIYNKNSPSS